MDKNGYIRSFSKALPLPGDKRAQVVKEVRALIREKEEGGEAWTEIVAGLGSPQELAKAYGEQASPEDRRRAAAQRRWSVAAYVLAALALVAALGYWGMPKTYSPGKSGYFSSAELGQKSRQVVEWLEQGDFASLQGLYDERMAAVFNADVWARARGQVLTEEQRLEDFGREAMAEVLQSGKWWGIVELEAAYTGGKTVVYRLSFDVQGRLGGLYLR